MSIRYAPEILEQWGTIIHVLSGTIASSWFEDCLYYHSAHLAKEVDDLLVSLRDETGTNSVERLDRDAVHRLIRIIGNMCEHVVHLLRSDAMVLPALPILATVARRGGSVAKSLVRRFIPSITRMLEGCPSSSSAAQWAISTIAFATKNSHFLDGASAPASSNIPPIFRTVSDLLFSKFTAREPLQQAFLLLGRIVEGNPMSAQNFPTIPRILVALMHSHALQTRARAMQILVNYPGDQPRTYDLRRYFAGVTRSLPSHISAVIEGGGGKAECSDDDLQDADILDMMHLQLQNRSEEAASLGRAAIARDPSFAHAYYVAALSDDHERGLEHALKGLTFTGTTLCVRTRMQCVAVAHAVQLGLESLLQTNDVESAGFAKGKSLLKQGLEITKAFMAEAPPDEPYMLTMLGWYILLSVTLRGPKLSSGLEEFEDIRRTVGISVELMQHVGYPYWTSHVFLAAQELLQNYSATSPKDCAMVRRFDELVNGRVFSGGDRRSLCSWCKETLTIVRKCKGCMTTR
ncbi:hypothetical protein C8Q76DRAFT_694548 [Earliella scabrosa]|nr:hypothetical protein C8Q76DRAFT_694548 [Earliella scabrosa]